MNITILLVLISLIILIGVVFILFRRKPTISNSRASQFIKKINQTKNLDPAHSLMESHKLFITAIEQLKQGKQITAANRVSAIASNLPNEKKIWYFHRMRNRVAHEAGFKVSITQANEAREQFIRALKSLT